MIKLYANYGRKNKPREGPDFLRLMAIRVVTSAGLFDRVVHCFSIVISNVHKRNVCTILWRLRYRLVHC
ncbi:hypothetical protein EMIT0194MI4_100104 [Pseudomonas sp. IT-194MI4]